MARFVAVCLSFFLCNALRATPQEEPPCCKKGVPQPWPEYNQGVEWTIPNKNAFAEAKEKGSLVLYFLLVGDLDKGGC